MKCVSCGAVIPQLKHVRNSKSLSVRESEVFACVIRGLSSKAIGKALFITEKTVKFHLTNIYKKLGITQRAELISGWYMKRFDSDVVVHVAAFLAEPEAPEEVKEEIILSSGAI
jgi:DNA-binding CsgD family transcriptional regulator